MSDEQRREYNKERRKKKRRRLAIEQNMREEGWDEWEAGGTGSGSAKSEIFISLTVGACNMPMQATQFLRNTQFPF
ncbi:hypothetical protein N7530_009012 [Penicillium desertorum]|uniref:Uncharacterized protein n=1 Tax=Penicillium desertorum TaxID=1303715 RepID=A0A9W9WQ62_9EURO|nr:hypothetical protein N7530_009012 [Penicillium desertorum]